MANSKPMSLDELYRQVSLLKAGADKSTKKQEQVDENEIVDDDEDLDNIEVHGSDDIDVDDEPENEIVEDSEEVTEDSVEQIDDSGSENFEKTEGLAEISEKLDSLTNDFNKFKNKVISLLEATLAANRIHLGLDKTETPRLEVEKKKEGTLNTAEGDLTNPVVGYVMSINDNGILKVTNKYVTIKKGTAVENELEIEGKIPFGDWLVVENKENYYLVSTENFDGEVTPYEDEDSQENEKASSGQVVNKKGVAHNVRGYELKALDDCFKLTEKSLKNPVKVHNAKWTKDCDNHWPVKGKEMIPEGTWVIVYDDDEDMYYLVKSDNVEPKVSTKKTEPEKKKAVKKVAASKSNKKVVSKKPVSKKKKK